MRYYELAGTGEKISAIGMGCMRIADMTDQDARLLVENSLACGINFFDHADIYGGGECERVFGRLFRETPSLRDQMFLQSKCAIHDGLFDFSADYIRKSVDGILERLGTDHLDSLLLHRPDVLMEPEEVAKVFDELKAAGKVTYFGVANENRYQMELLESELSEPLFADQMQMSIVHTPMIDSGLNVNMLNDPSVMRDAGTLEYLRLKKKILQIWSPLQIGYFEGVFLNNSRYPELNARMIQMAEEKQTTVDTLAYAWLLRIPAMVQVITGTTKIERIRMAVDACDLKLDRREWYELYKAAGRQLP